MEVRLGDTNMFYGFKPPLKDDMVFKVSGDVEQVRLFDYTAREVLCGAVESTIGSGIRHYFAESLHWLTERFASFVSWLGRYKVLKPLVWLLSLPLVAMILASNKARKADFVKRHFVKDADGNYTFMSRSVAMEHGARSVLSQLSVTTKSEHFPAGFSRNPKPQKNGSATFSFTTPTGKSVVVDFWG